MSRSGYCDDGDNDNWSMICWQGAVKSATKGARGQALLRDLLAALDAMPVKSLVAGELQADGEFCALGAVGHAKGMDLASIDTENWGQLSAKFNIAEALAREIMYVNDEAVGDYEWVWVEVFGPLQPWMDRQVSIRMPNTNAGWKRWNAVRAWVAKSIIEPVAPLAANPSTGK